MSIVEHMKIQQLEEEIKLLKMAHAQKDNFISAAISLLEDGDIEDATNLLKDVVGEAN